MTIQAVLREIKKHRWWSEEFPGVYAFAGWPLRAFLEQPKYFHPTLPSFCVFVFRNDFVFEETPAEQKRAIYDFLIARVKQDASYLKRQRRASAVAAAKFLRTARLLEKLERDFSSSNRALARQYARFVAAYLDLVRYGAFLECVDVFSSEALPQLIRAECPTLTAAEAVEAAITMTAPDSLSFFEQEEMLLFEGAISGRISRRNEIAQLLARDFFWIGNNYKQARVLDAEYFLSRMGELAREKTRAELVFALQKYRTKIRRLKLSKRSLRNRLEFSRDLGRHFGVLSFIASWIDDRKRLMTTANHYHELFCREIARRFALDIWQVKYYTPEEFTGLLLRGKRVAPSLLQRRRRFSAQVVYRRGGWKACEQIFYGRQAKTIFRALFPPASSEICGQVASAPIVKFRGVADVVLDVAKDRFRDGHILVTTMTRPDFLPLMRKAVAIVTDEGGLTCHAAVISRELGIPCIIGTKVATKVLKSGDRVELDLKNGNVHKLK